MRHWRLDTLVTSHGDGSTAPGQSAANCQSASPTSYAMLGANRACQKVQPSWQGVDFRGKPQGKRPPKQQHWHSPGWQKEEQVVSKTEACGWRQSRSGQLPPPRATLSFPLLTTLQQRHRWLNSQGNTAKRGPTGLKWESLTGVTKLTSDQKDIRFL